MTKPCAKPDCDAPCMISPKTGKPLSMCEAHQREYWNDKKADSNKRKNAAAEGEGKTRKPLGRPRKHPASAPIAALASSSVRPMNRAPLAVSVHPQPVAPTEDPLLAMARQSPHKLLLINEATGEIWSVTAVRHYAHRTIKQPATLDVLRAAGMDIMYVTGHEKKGAQS